MSKNKPRKSSPQKQPNDDSINKAVKSLFLPEDVNKLSPEIIESRFESLPPNVRAKVQENIVHEMSISRSPYPSPEELQRYEKVLTGSSERILKQCFKQSDHRIEKEKKMMDADITYSKTGQWFGFIIAMTGIITGGVLIGLGNPVTGSILSGGSLASLVGTFVYGKQTKEKELDKKKQRVRDVKENVTTQEVAE